LGVGEDPRVQVQVVVRLGLVDVAGSAAGHRLELLELDPELRRKRLGRDVELLRGQRGEAALVVGDARHQAPPPGFFVGSSPGVTSAWVREPWPSSAPPGTWPFSSPGRYGRGNEPSPYGSW